MMTLFTVLMNLQQTTDLGQEATEAVSAIQQISGPSFGGCVEYFSNAEGWQLVASAVAIVFVTGLAMLKRRSKKPGDKNG
jgi:hypothetical protein